MTSTVNVAIIGAGSAVAPGHHPAFTALPNVQVVAGVDTSATVRARLRDEWDVPIYPNIVDLDHAHPDLHLAIVCVPDHLHDEVARGCLDRGWHTLVEKPLATSYQAAASLFQHAAMRDRWLGAGHQRALMAPGLDSLAVLATHGPVRSISAWWHVRDNGPEWRLRLPAANRAGVLADLGSHLITQVDRLMTHTLPVSVTATLTRTTDGQVETGAEATITYANGVKATINARWSCVLSSVPEDTQLHITADLGTVHAPLLTYDTAQQAHARRPVLRRIGHPDTRLQPLRTVPDCHNHLAARVIAAVRRGDPADPAEITTTLRTIAILAAAYDSAEQGRPVPITL